MIMFIHQFLQKKMRKRCIMRHYRHFICTNQYILINEREYEYIIIGSGPGLQCAYLEKLKKTYLIFEKTNEVISFKKQPIHRKLISINKVHEKRKRI